MLELKSLDEQVPIFQQLNADVSPVVLVNVFTASESDIPSLLKAWEEDANWMKRRPGYISIQLHRGIAGSSVFMNYPASTIASPHLYTRLAVPTLCVGPWKKACAMQN